MPNADVNSPFSGHQGLDPYPLGEFLFSDGTWGSLEANTGKTPVALIFSNETSTADKENGLDFSSKYDTNLVRPVIAF